MKILIACEWSQSLTEQFILKGHDAMSCDIYDAAKGYPHYKGNVADLLGDKWDMVVAFPPCTYLAKGQIHLYENEVGRKKKTMEAVEFVKSIYFSGIPKVAIENPIGLLSRLWRQPEQIISPHLFGDLYKKDICLWLKGLPMLDYQNLINPQVISGSSQAHPQVIPGSSQAHPQVIPGSSQAHPQVIPGSSVKYKKVVNHVNSSMSKEMKSKIKSNWKYFPKLCHEIAEQWG